MDDAKKNRRWMALGILLLVVSVITGVIFSRGGTVKSVDVSEMVFTTPEDVLKAARIETGTEIDSVGYLSAIERVEKLPYVKRASMRLRPNGALGIQIEERQPIARLVSDGAQAMVDADGAMMPVITGVSVDVPVLHGFRVQRGDTLRGAAFTITRDFLLAAASSPMAGITLKEYTYDPREGVVALSSESGVRVLFGKEGFEERLRHWEAFYGQVVPQKGIARFTWVDLRYRGQIITKESI
jgi:cell division protein FtsQ